MGSAASTSHPSTTCLRSSRTSPIINLVNFDKVALSLVGTRILYSDFTDPTEDTTNMAEFDTLALRNRDVTKTLSPVEDLGQDKRKPETNGDAAEFDKLELRRRPTEQLMEMIKKEQLMEMIKKKNMTLFTSETGWSQKPSHPWTNSVRIRRNRKSQTQTTNQPQRK